MNSMNNINNNHNNDHKKENEDQIISTSPLITQQNNEVTMQDEDISNDQPPTNEELKQLVDFLDPLKNDHISSERFNALSNLSQQELHSQIRRLEEWAYVLGLDEAKQIQKAKLLGILNSN